MHLLLNYLQYSDLMEDDLKNQMMEAATEGDEGNPARVLELTSQMPKLNLTTLKYIIKIFREHFLEHATNESISTALTLLSTVVFQVRLSTEADPMKKMATVIRTFKILYDQLDCDDVEVME